MRKAFILFLAVGMVLATTGCNGGTSESSPKKPLTDSDGVDFSDNVENPPNDILLDKFFRNGFRLTSNGNAPNPTYLGEYVFPDRPDAYPNWILTQWATKYMIQPTHEPVKEEDWYVWKDESKEVKVDTEHGYIYLGCEASKEYDSPRGPMEEWPHLLIEQYTSARCPDLDSLSSLRLKLDFCIEKCERKMTDEEFKDNLHTAQFSLCTTLSNQNRESLGYGDTIWFNLNFFDWRYDWNDEGISVDGGKESATGLAMYSPDSRKYLSAPTAVGNRITVDFDVLPDIRNALKLAKEYDGVSVFKNTTLRDLKFTTMNLGWELPGTFDVGLTIYDFSFVWEE